MVVEKTFFGNIQMSIHKFANSKVCLLPFESNYKYYFREILKLKLFLNKFQTSPDVIT